MSFSDMEASEILPSHLFLGSWHAARNLEELKTKKVKYIVNCTKEVENFYEGTSQFAYVRLGLDDSFFEDSTRAFEVAFQIIERARKEKAAVLVHCQAGISRSATVVMAYLMEYKGMSLRQAFFHIKDRRPQISPNASFMTQLCKYEESIYGGCSFNLKEYFKQVLLDMGFQEDKVVFALNHTAYNFDLAVGLLLQLGKS